MGGRRRGGRRLKRLPGRWGLGGKRAGDTPPTPPKSGGGGVVGFSSLRGDVGDAPNWGRCVFRGPRNTDSSILCRNAVSFFLRNLP